MTDFLKCPTCAARMAVDPGDGNQVQQCEKCGGYFTPKSSSWNPYDPPSSSLGQGEDGQPGAIAVPATFFGKFGLGFRLLADNLLLYSMIMLTVWLPANIAFEYYLVNSPAGQDTFFQYRLNSVFQGLFGTISVGAMVFALARRMEGNRVGYFQAIGFGFRNWGRLFAADLAAGFFILLGYVALIVPGIILSVRYSLLAPVVVLERASFPRERSTELTAGRRWQLFFADVLFYGAFNLASYGSGYALTYLWEMVEWLDGFWLDVASDCVFNVLECIFLSVTVSFYLEARDQNLLQEDKTIGDFEIRTRMTDV